MQRINNPVANGSNVPACPIFLHLIVFLIFFTTSNEVQSILLSTKIVWTRLYLSMNKFIKFLIVLFHSAN